jgi:hypothetical protein
MKTFALDEGFGGFDFCVQKDGSAEAGLKGIGLFSSLSGENLMNLKELTTPTETAYLLKYVDKKDSPKDFSNPWSIRQALIYQKSNLVTNQDTYIFMRLSELLGARFGDILSKRRAQERGVKFLHWSEIHTMAFQSVVVNWREYINWLDGDVSQLVSSSIFVHLERMLTQHSLTTSFSPQSSQPNSGPSTAYPAP